ncbi:MAG: hypothetical protein RLZZ568_1976 [Cyanobacteriota bacterium]|jgi:phage host-nuclease inhibitor protein Gam
MKHDSDTQSPLLTAQEKEIAILSNRLRDEQFETKRLRTELKTIAARYQGEIETLKQGIETLLTRVSESQAMQDQLNQEIRTLNAQLSAMESSKFWQLREYWFQVKQKLGLPVR